jgi:two-component system sensor histidine kinase UhpB
MIPAAPVATAAHPARGAELYLIDPVSLRLVELNAAARANLGYAPARLAQMTLPEIAPRLDVPALRAALAALGPQLDARFTLPGWHRRADASLYPIELAFLRTERAGRTLIVASGADQGAEAAARAALEQVQARFEAIVHHTPGLVYQFVLRADGTPAFPYLSEGCTALLGVTPAQLQDAPERFLDLILAEDRAAYLESMRASAATLANWNWEGRIWIDAWNDVKWINLRSSPRALPEQPGAVQWEGIMSNISASWLERLDATRSRAQLAELTAHSEQVKEHERGRIAREIHDDLGGNLTAIKMALAMLARRLPPEPAQLAERAAYVDALVDRTIEAVQRIALDLRPPLLDFGIVAALEWQLKEFDKRMGIACAFTSNEREMALAPELATALFRIVQEALTNIAKHAGASRVTVALQRQRRHLTLRIGDNGAGLAAADRHKPHSFGLRGMSERAAAFGGSLALAPAAGGGTVVTIKIPLEAAKTPIMRGAGPDPAPTVPEQKRPHHD